VESHVKDDNNHVMVFLAMDGYVYMHHFKNGDFGLLGSALSLGSKKRANYLQGHLTTVTKKNRAAFR
jgi:hypothetical protein